MEKNVQQPSASSTPGDAIPILMPQAGNSMEEGTVVAWLVKEGDRIEVGQIICEIETDKATIEYESPAAGRLARIVAQVDVPVPVQELIALLADDDATADAYLAAQGSTSASTKPAVAGASSQADATPSSGNGRQQAAAPAPVSATGRIKASPAARKVAAQRGIPLASVAAGSGPGGRVLSTDVPVAAAPESTSGRSATERRSPMSNMRRAIAVNLQQSKQTIPHFYVRVTIDADPLMAFYREQKAQTHCTLNDVVILAVGRTIAQFPAVRSQIQGGDLVEFPHANIGIAVGVEDGLVVPVVLKVDTLSLAQLAVETQRVVENGRNGKLENLGQGVFTISNLGMFGVEEFSAIINPPESGILAVAAVRETAIVEDGAIRPGRTMTMTLSADHRVVDGLVAAKFVARLKEILEHPVTELT
jgi:pyruvate dehydrogenase E2 component (dihydrolipoamide acetyltransferase)